MPDIFLSYSRDDQVTARRFAEALEREGFSVWWDEALNPGETFDKVTEQALRDARAVVVLWSRRSVDSRWVRSEATQADRYGKLVPVTIEPCDRPILFELTHTADLSGWNGEGGDARWRTFVGRLRAFVDKGNVPAAAATTQVPSTTAAVRDSAPAPRQRLVWIAAAAAVLVAAGLLWLWQGRGAGNAATASDSSIAVMPFDNFSSDAEQGYFADGLAEEILNILAGIPELKVTGRTSSFTFKGQHKDPRTIGRELGVAHLLVGSVRRTGEQLRVSAQLIRTETGFQLWSRQYDRPIADVFTLQEDIARSVAETLQVSLGVGFGKRPGMTRDIEAYDAYLQATALIGQYSPDALRRATALLEQAVARDPDYLGAWQQLIVASSQVSMLSSSITPGEAKAAQGRLAAAIEAIGRIAGKLGIPASLLQGPAAADGSLKEAGEAYRDMSPEMLRVIGAADGRGPPELLLMVGRSREAASVLEQAKARDPLNTDVATLLGRAYAMSGDFTAAFAEFERAERPGAPGRLFNSGSATTAALAARDPAQIRRWLDVGSAAAAGNRTAEEFNARMRQLLDQPEAALVWLREQARDPAASPLLLSVLAQYLAYHGDPQAALDALRRAPPVDVPAIFSPLMREVRSLPDFKIWARDYGLVDYWREFAFADVCRPVGDEDFDCD